MRMWRVRGPRFLRGPSCGGQTVGLTHLDAVRERLFVGQIHRGLLGELLGVESLAMAVEKDTVATDLDAEILHRSGGATFYDSSDARRQAIAARRVASFAVADWLAV